MSVSNDINLAAVGERWRGIARGIDNFAFLSVGTGLGAGLVIGGELITGHRGGAGEIDFALDGSQRDDPCAAAISDYAATCGAKRSLPTRLEAPYALPAIFARARAGDPLAEAVVAEAARRVAVNVMPIAAVVDVRSLSSAEASAQTETCCWPRSASGWLTICRFRLASRSRSSATRPC